MQGTIIDFKEDKSRDGISYPAIVSYTTISGDKVIATSKTSSNVKPRIGKIVSIIYSPTNPSEFYFLPSTLPITMGFSILSFGAGGILSIMQLIRAV